MAAASAREPRSADTPGRSCYGRGVDLRTFLPARELAVGPVPQPGDRAPELPGMPADGRPAIVAFLRHTGCPFAEQTLRMLREQAAGSPGVRWIAVSHAAPEGTSRWCAAVGGAGAVDILNDPSRLTYAAWGLGRTTLGHFAGMRSLAAAASLARQGIRNRHPSGTRWQSAGTFALDGDRVVRWRHLPEHAGDLPDLEQALQALG
jgi:hypothetical protein